MSSICSQDLLLKGKSVSLEIFSDYSLISLQVSDILGDDETLFVSYVKLHKIISAKTLAQWMKVVLTDLGVDPSLWKPHAVRAASSTHHSSVRKLDLGGICRLADWSMASSTYSKFYKLYV